MRESKSFFHSPFGGVVLLAALLLAGDLALRNVHAAPDPAPYQESDRLERNGRLRSHRHPTRGIGMSLRTASWY